MRFPAATALCLLCVSGVAQADPPPAPSDGARGVAQAQAALAQAQGEAARLSANRLAVQAELDQLGTAIAEKKRALAAGVEPGAELTAMLRDSARLAAQLGELQRDAEAAAARSQRAADDLAHNCSTELATLQLLWSQSATAPRGRAALETRIADVSRSCSGQRLGQLDKPAAAIPVAALAPVATDDAQALKEKADFLRDREDVLRRRIGQMSQRIEALGRERALARRVSEFVKEQDLFDEDDTRVAVARTEYGAAATPQSPANPNTTAAQVDSNRGAGSPGLGSGGGAGSVPVNGNSGGAGGSFTNNPAPGSLGGVASPSDVPAGTEGSQGSRQTYIGARPEDVRVDDSVSGDDDSLEGLRAHKAALEQEAKKLHEAADALEHSAAEGR